jgi:hypothetical protein
MLLGPRKEQQENGIGAKFMASKELLGIWSWMISRCYNPKDEHYKDYGGRGITVYHPQVFTTEEFPDNRYSGYWFDPIVKERNSRKLKGE